MLKRIPEKSGYWQPVCGGIEDGESVIEAGKREVIEETGITSWLNIELLPNTFTYQEAKNEESMQMKDYCMVMCIEACQNVDLSWEHEAYKWCSGSQIEELTDWAPILTVINDLRGRLNL